MIFKHKQTLKRVSLLIFDLYKDKVILLDGDNDKLQMSISEFHKNYEYVWMPPK